MGIVRKLCRLFALTLLFFGAIAHQPVQAECKMAKLGTFPVDVSGKLLLIPGKLNGLAITILVDTGAKQSLIWLNAAQKAGLNPTRDQRFTMVDVSGETQAYRVKVDELVIGDFAVRNKVWPVIGGKGIVDDELGMILGADFWSKVDFEINLQDGEMVLWEASGCGKSSLAYWSREFMLALLDKGEKNSIKTDVLISGKKVPAMIDTGAAVTVMDSSLARHIGFLETPADIDPGQVTGIGNRGGVDSFVATFESFQLGDLTVKNAQIRVLDMDKHRRTRGSRISEPIVDFEKVIIGADFLRANRVLVANSQGYLYMTYNGGRIFQTEPPSEETTRPSGQ